MADVQAVKAEAWRVTNDKDTLELAEESEAGTNKLYPRKTKQ